MESDQIELLTNIAAHLKHHNIPYMITGAWNVIYFGRPRASHDIDFIVELEMRNLPVLFKLLQSLGSEYEFQTEEITTAVTQKSMFNVIYLPTFMKLDFWLLKEDEFDQTRFTRRKSVRILQKPVVISTAEDTILQKLRWYKEAKIEKHLIDAAFVYQIQKKNLDQKYLRIG